MTTLGYSLETWNRAFPRRTSAMRMRGLRRVRDTGDLERRNPLPVGRYWVDVFEKDSEAFNAWLAEKKGSVAVRTVEHFETTPPRDWVLFEVTTPVDWRGPGFPDVATPDVHTSNDTVQKPPPEPTGADALGKWFGGLGTGATVALILGAAAIAVVALKR